jgi:AcrR family transcriptional regulator
MSVRKTKQEVVSEFRCSEILRAACRVFARGGFDAATVDEIADAAGLAKGTVYVYFHSKRDVYLAALRQGTAALTEETKRNIDRAPTIAAKIRAFIATRVHFAEENRAAIGLDYGESGNAGHPGCQREFKSLYAQQARPLETVLQQAALEGQIRNVCPEAAAFFVIEMTRALIRRRVLGWSRASADEEVQSLFDLVWQGLGVACDC